MKEGANVRIIGGEWRGSLGHVKGTHSRVARIRLSAICGSGQEASGGVLIPWGFLRDIDTWAGRVEDHNEYGGSLKGMDPASPQPGWTP